MEEDADEDEDVARVLAGAEGDPERIRENMRQALQNKDMFMEQQGVDTPPHVTFRQINPFALWVWVEFARGPPSGRELDLLEAVLQAWFMVGKLGGYNSQNMQVFYSAGDDQSYFEYDNPEAGSSQGSQLHDVSEVERRGTWARFRLDMGTCDELALDVLLNSLMGYSRDLAGLKQVVVGGENADWPLPDTPLYDEEYEGLRPDIDPMSLPEGVDEELSMLDELEAQGLLTQRGAGRKPGPKIPLLPWEEEEYQQARQAAAEREGASGDGAMVGSTRVPRRSKQAAAASPAQVAAAQPAAPKQWGQGLVRRHSEEEVQRALQSSRRVFGPPEAGRQ